MPDDLTQSDELDALFGRLAGGDRTAIGRAFQLLHPLVQRFCLRLIGNRTDSDDATQQALERIFERISTYDPSRHAIPWALALATWEVRTIRRRTWRAKNRQSTTDENAVVGRLPDPEATAMSRQVLAAVGEAIEDLGDTDREVLMQVIEREVIPELEGLNDATFRKRKERAMGRLRSLLRNLGHVQ